MNPRTRLRPIRGACEARLPWYPVHPADLDGDQAFRLASLAERGALLSLWNLQWTSHDDVLPSDPVGIGRLLGIPREEAEAVLPFIRRYFAEDGSGGMADPRLTALRQEGADLSRKRQAAAAKRWGSSEA